MAPACSDDSTPDPGAAGTGASAGSAGSGGSTGSTGGSAGASAAGGSAGSAGSGGGAGLGGAGGVPAGDLYAIGVPKPNTQVKSNLEPFPYDPLTLAAPDASTRPEWPGAESAGAYYVDSTSPNASDDLQSGEQADANGRRYGYPDRPRITLPVRYDGKRSVLPAGSYIEVAPGGRYDFAPQRIEIEFQGSAQEPCWLRGSSEQVLTEFGGTMSFDDSKYFFVENLKLDGKGQNSQNVAIGTALSANQTETAYGTFRNIELTDYDYISGGAGSISVSARARTHHIVFYRLWIHDTDQNLTNVTGDPDHHGIGISGTGPGADAGAEVDHIWVLSSKIERVSGNGVQLITTGTANQSPTGHIGDMLHHIWVAKTMSGYHRQAGLWSKQARDVVFSENECYGSRRHGSQPGDGIGYQYGADYIWLIANRLYDNNHGVRQSDTSQVLGFVPKAFIVGNLIFDNQKIDGPVDNGSWDDGVGIALWQGNQERYIVDNSLFSNNMGIAAIQGDASTKTIISGNIIADIGPASNSGLFISVENAGKNGTAMASNNLLFDPEGNFSIKWQTATSSGTQSSLMAWQSANASSVSANLEGDPEFESASVDPQQSNLQPRAGSPALDASATSAADGSDVYAIFLERYGIDIFVDALNRPRSVGTGKDIGALERQ